jgi:alkanesulfonate monooxygenase SsuD/methylene tetrahydromethanopterin reductase-like flavin-dependent oxidoreductase (luciferase family)
VLARIASADGWLARAAGNQQMIKDDVRVIRDYFARNGRDPDTLRYGHLNFLHLVDTSDREEALRRQRLVFERVMGTHRTTWKPAASRTWFWRPATTTSSSSSGSRARSSDDSDDPLPHLLYRALSFTSSYGAE